MIAQVLRLTVWEWFKLRRRWQPWILLSVAIVLAQVGLWVSYTAYHNDTLQELMSGGGGSMGTAFEQDGETISVSITCAEIVNGQTPEGIEKLTEDERRKFLADVERFREESCSNVEARETIREGFALPSAIPSTISSLFDIAAFLVLILTASALGTEYGWGTLRTALTRGTGRWQLLSSKLVLLMLLGAAGFLVLGATAAFSSILAAVIPPAESGGLFDSGSWGDAAVTFGKAVYGLAPYVALAALLTVLTQSSAAGMSIGMGYFVVELIFVPLLRNFEWFEGISEALLGTNVDKWMQVSLVEVEISSGGVPSEQMTSDTLQAFFILLAYTAVLAAAAFVVFQRRDITGAKGG